MTLMTKGHFCAHQSVHDTSTKNMIRKKKTKTFDYLPNIINKNKKPKHLILAIWGGRCSHPRPSGVAVQPYPGHGVAGEPPQQAWGGCADYP
jgi:hypothetical protein